eukprot:scaffold12.g8015.t1
MSGGATTLRDADIDDLVLQYLRKRNFTEAGKVLELEIRESRSTGTAAMALQHWLDVDSGVVDNLVFGAAAEGDPAAYVQSFERLAAWVDGSLDLYKPELEALLYPVFVHCYLLLMAAGAAAEAHALMSGHGRRFLEDAAGVASRARARQLQDLQAAASPEALAASPTAAALRAHRHRVRVCAYAYGLLMRFLQGGSLLLLLGLLNEHVNLQARLIVALTIADVHHLRLVYDGAPDPTAPPAADEAVAPGAGAADALATNQQPLELQLLAGGVEDEYTARQAQREEEEALARAAEAATTKKQRIPLPELSDEARAAAMAQLPHRAPLSPAALPSAACFTFVNTHQSLNAIAFASDASALAGGFADSSVRLFDLAAARAASGAAASTSAAGAGGGGGGVGGAVYLTGHSGPVYAADFSPDDALLLTASADGTVRLWSRELAAGLVAYRGHMLPVWDVASCPTYGYYFASAGADKTARLWSTERSQALRVFVGHGADVDVVRWHPNCHYIATGSSDRSVRLWDVRTGGAARVLVGHQAPVTALAFSPDGATLASGDADGAICVWDLAGAKRLATLADHSRAVWSLAYSHGDGAILASGGADCTLRLWDATAAATGGGGGAASVATQQQQLQREEGGGGGALLRTFRTKATPVLAARFSSRNLLLCGGALTLYRPARLYH